MPTDAAARRTLLAAAGVVCAIWAFIIVAWSETPFTLTFDDAYYYFEVAKNIAAGHGSTFDQINHTNGYHPLWMGLSTLPFLAGLDGLAAVRSLLLLQLAGWFLTLATIAGVVARARQGWSRLGDRPGAAWCDGAMLTAFVLLAVNPFVLKLFVNGLESNLVGLVGAVLLARSAAAGGRFTTGTTARWRWVTGALLAVAFLSRTDALLLFAVLGVWCLLQSRAVRPLVELFALPAIALAGFVAVNLIWFGEPTQVSGEVKRLPLTASRVALVAGFAVIALAVLAWGRRAAPATSRFPRTSAFARSTAWYAATCISLVAYYVVLQSVPYLWYFAPVALYAIVLALMAVADFAEGALVESPGTRAPARAAAPVLAILLIPLLGGLAYQTREITDPNLRSLQTGNRRAGEWISAHLPSDAVLGSFDAGVVGYFTEQRVMNLDGVINSYEYLDARRAGTEATTRFLRDRDLGYLVNHGLDVDGDDPDMRAIADRLLGKGTGDRLVLVERWTFLYSGNLDGSRTDQGLKHMAVFLYEVPEEG